MLSEVSEVKVVLLSATPPPVGGIATWTLRMLNIDPKYDCRYYLVDEKMIGGRDMFGNNKRNLHDELKRCISIWKNLNDTININDPDIIQSCIPSSTLSMLREYVCACITKIRNKKFIIHFHCTVPNTCDSFLWKILLKLISNISDMIFVLNKQSKEYLKQYTSTEIVIIPNFVEEKEIANNHRVNNKITNILYVGGVIESKGVGDIIEVAKVNPEICFKLAGNPEKSIIEKAEKVRNVVLLGQLDREQVKNELKKNDVFMFLSRFPGEGFSMALLEAMAAGLPCIVTDWAANKDMISDEGGITVESYSIENINDAINKMQDPVLRKKQSDRNIKKVKHSFSADVVFKQYVRMYKRCIRGNEANTE